MLKGEAVRKERKKKGERGREKEGKCIEKE